MTASLWGLILAVSGGALLLVGVVLYYTAHTLLALSAYTMLVITIGVYYYLQEVQ